MIVKKSTCSCEDMVGSNFMY